MMEADRVKDVWYHLAWWYCCVRVKHAHPTREGLDQDLAVRSELYRFRPPTRLKVTILVQQTEVNDDVPTEAEVELAVWGLKGGRAGGPSGMREEDLKGWRKETKWKKDT